MVGVDDDDMDAGGYLPSDTGDSNNGVSTGPPPAPRSLPAGIYDGLVDGLGEAVGVLLHRGFD